jgi:hypothetical protein
MSRILRESSTKSRFPIHPKFPTRACPDNRKRRPGGLGAIDTAPIFDGSHHVCPDTCPDYSGCNQNTPQILRESPTHFPIPLNPQRASRFQSTRIPAPVNIIPTVWESSMHVPIRVSIVVGVTNTRPELCGSHRPTSRFPISFTTSGPIVTDTCRNHAQHISLLFFCSTREPNQPPRYSTQHCISTLPRNVISRTRDKSHVTV